MTDDINNNNTDEKAQSGDSDTIIDNDHADFTKQLPHDENAELSMPYYGKKKKHLHFADKLTNSEFIIQLIAIIVTGIMRAVEVNMFANPNKLSTGGLTGIGTILYNALGWNIALTVFVMNVPLLILAFFFINKRFALLTLLSTGVASACLQIFNFLPAFTDNTFVAAVMAGVISGIAIGILLRVNCSTGGTDIIGLLIQNKFPNAKVVWLFFILNLLTGVAAGIVFMSLDLVIYSAITILTSSYACDLLQRGLVSTFEVKIITSYPTEIADYVMNVMHRGASMMKTMGMYTGEEHSYLICIVRKRQLSQLKHAVKAIDEKSFMYVTSVYDTIGRGFNNDIVPKSKIK